MLEIDCSYGEGGGQLVRSAISLSAFTGIPIILTNIRSNRPNPGLARQHITAVQAVGKLCNANISEIRVGTDKLEFRPGNLKSGKFSFDIGTAGSITLVLQACLIPVILGDIQSYLELNLRGGTDVNWSPQFDYFRSVFIETLKLTGIYVQADILRRGYYPKGGGEVRVKIKKNGANVQAPENRFKKLSLTTRGNLLGIKGVIHSRKLPSHVSLRILSSAKQRLEKYSNVNIEIDSNGQSYSPGTGIVLAAEYEHSILGASALGALGVPAEQVGENAAEGLITELDGLGTVDVYLADQLVPYLAILGGELKVRELSSHTKTNIWLTEQFIKNPFQVKEQKGGFMVSV
jgi:RNA 3'-phosphate cyclase